MKNPGRNDPCPCGGGKKFKLCCGRLDAPQAGNPHPVESSIPASLQLALEHQQAGRLSQAEALYRKILGVVPNHADALHLSGLVSHQRGDNTAAIELIGKAVMAKPTEPIYYNSLGNILQIQGRLEEAVDCYRQALSFKPDFAEALGNQAAALQAQGWLDEAAACARQALALRPDHVETYNNLGNVLQAQGQFDEAVASYRQALALRPDYAEAHSNLGNTLQTQDRLDEAAACYRRALSIRPDYAEAHSNLGNLLQAQGQLGEAISCYRQALLVNPMFVEAQNNLGNALKAQLRLDEAIASYRQALAIKPGFVDAHSNLLFCLNYHPDLSAAEVFAEHRLWDERQTSACAPLARPVGDRQPERRLRIGYVSPDLRQHSVAYFFEPLLRTHDRQAVEVFCYAEVARPDAVTARLRGLADYWLGTVGMSDEALAQRIADDRIDILVDLAGHTENNRLRVFARKPAPVQVSWLGYPHSTGLAAMDYRLVDALSDPPGEADAWASETLVRLDRGFLCYAAPAQAPVPAEPPCLGGGGITFGSFNNPTKLSPATLDAWAELLHRVPDARLLLKGKLFAEAASSAAFIGRLAQRGVAAGRVALLGFVPGQDDHLGLYGQVDIALDPFPYNGTTTTCEALWMGVPVVSLRGDRHAGRVGASLLTQAGMTEWIADSARAYVDIAAALAGDRQRLRELRQTLRPKLAASPLCDAPAFARQIEATYREIWRRWCAELQSSSVAAPPPHEMAPPRD